MNVTLLDTVVRRSGLSMGHVKFQEKAESLSFKMYISMEKNVLYFIIKKLQLISKYLEHI